MIRKLFAFGLAVVLALMPVQAFGKTVSVTNVSYDPTREMFEQYNKIFEDHWKEKTGVVRYPELPCRSLGGLSFHVYPNIIIDNGTKSEHADKNINITEISSQLLINLL